MKLMIPALALGLTLAATAAPAYATYNSVSFSTSKTQQEAGQSVTTYYDLSGWHDDVWGDYGVYLYVAKYDANDNLIAHYGCEGPGLGFSYTPGIWYARIWRIDSNHTCTNYGTGALFTLQSMYLDFFRESHEDWGDYTQLWMTASGHIRLSSTTEVSTTPGQPYDALGYIVP
jgi:hypothetical protein